HHRHPLPPHPRRRHARRPRGRSPVRARPGGADPACLRLAGGAPRGGPRAGQLAAGRQAAQLGGRRRSGGHGRTGGDLMSAMTLVYIVGVLLLLAAALMALVRIERGPSMFDRILGLDVITAVLIGTVTLIAAVTNRVDLVPVLVVLALVGFIGAVTVARFAA